MAAMKAYEGPMDAVFAAVMRDQAASVADQKAEHRAKLTRVIAEVLDGWEISPTFNEEGYFLSKTDADAASEAAIEALEREGAL